MTYSNTEKLAEIEREIAMRRRVYPAAIAKGSLSLGQASRQIDILREVASDLRLKAAAEEKLTGSMSSCVTDASESNYGGASELPRTTP